MSPTIHEIDPTGDTIIVLRNPRASSDFAIWSEQLEIPEGNVATASAVSQVLGNAVPIDTPDPVLFYVSSRHLILASRTFRNMLSGNVWSEGKKHEDGFYYITADDWHEESFLLLLNMLHLRDIPRRVSLEMLAKIAVLIDYYDCGQAVEFITTAWISELREEPIPSVYCRDLVLWILILSVFKALKGLEEAVRKAIWVCDEVFLETLELPIPEKITVVIAAWRLVLLHMGVRSLHAYLDAYSSPSYKCNQSVHVVNHSNEDDYSFECGSMLSGALRNHIMTAKLPTKPTWEVHYPGWSVQGLAQCIHAFRSPRWGFKHPCSFKDSVKIHFPGFISVFDAEDSRKPTSWQSTIKGLKPSNISRRFEMLMVKKLHEGLQNGTKHLDVA